MPGNQARTTGLLRSVSAALGAGILGAGDQESPTQVIGYATLGQIVARKTH